MTDKLVFCCCSGGLDSSVMVQKLRNDGYNPIPIFIDYGQKTAIIEFDHARRVWPAIRLIRFDLSNVIHGWATCPTTDFVPTPETERDRLFIPGRNIFLLLRLCVEAYYFSAHRLALGNNLDDLTCGDCKPPFLESFSRSLTLGMGTTERDYPVEILQPLRHMKKSDIVKYGSEHGVSVSDTWSCYDTKDRHCGVCWNCVDRKRAFKEAGVEDETGYLA